MDTGNLDTMGAVTEAQIGFAFEATEKGVP